MATAHEDKGKTWIEVAFKNLGIKQTTTHPFVKQNCAIVIRYP